MEDSRRDLKDDHLNSLLPDVQVDRRGFVAACIAAGFAVTAEPILAQAIKTPMDGLDGGDVKIGEIPAYYAVPKGKGKRPVVLVVAGDLGQPRAHQRRGAAGGQGRLFRGGQRALLPHRRAEQAREHQGGDRRREQASRPAGVRGPRRVVAWAGKHQRANVGKLGITGFCRGGRTVWMYTAHNKKVDAGVAWYGSLMPIPPAMPRRSARRHRQDRPPGARPLRRRRSGHSAGPCRTHARRPESVRKR